MSNTNCGPGSKTVTVNHEQLPTFNNPTVSCIADTGGIPSDIPSCDSIIRYDDCKGVFYGYTCSSGWKSFGPGLCELLPFNPAPDCADIKLAAFVDGACCVQGSLTIAELRACLNIPDPIVDTDTNTTSSVTNVIAGNRIATHGNGATPAANVDIFETITTLPYDPATGIFTFNHEGGGTSSFGYPPVAVGSIALGEANANIIPGQTFIVGQGTPCERQYMKTLTGSYLLNQPEPVEHDANLGSIGIMGLQTQDLKTLPINVYTTTAIASRTFTNPDPCRPISYRLYYEMTSNVITEGPGDDFGVLTRYFIDLGDGAMTMSATGHGTTISNEEGIDTGQSQSHSLTRTYKTITIPPGGDITIRVQAAVNISNTNQIAAATHTVAEINYALNVQLDGRSL